jgi:osmotically-inducible protein OsmY
MAWDNDFDNNRWPGNRMGRDAWGTGDLHNPAYTGYGARGFGGNYGAGNFGAGWGPGLYGGYEGNVGVGYGDSGWYGGYGGYGPWTHVGAPAYGGYGAYGGYPVYGGYAGGYARPARGYYGQGYASQGYDQGYRGQGDYMRGGYGREHAGQWDYGQSGQQTYWPEAYGQGSFGQTSFAGRGPRNYQRSDERIHEDINDRLTSHPGLDASDIQVMVSKGEVTLTGSVDSRWAKREAEDIADSTLGVTDVHNQLSANRQRGEREVGRATSREARTSESATEGRSRGKGSTATART